MDSKEIKVFLKQAREAIREKEFKTALKHCKAVLKIDKQNYNAWVFIGVSAQEMEQPIQAEAAFLKAIEISPDQHLAWQGLCQFYEKNEGREYKEKLIEPYIKIIELLKDEKCKKLEIIKKLWEIYIELNQAKKCLEILQIRIEASEGNALEEKNCWIDVLKLLENEKELSEKEHILLEKAYNELIQNEIKDNKDLNLEILKNYLQFLKKKDEFEKIVSVLKIYLKNYPEKDHILECFCELAIEIYIEKDIILEGIEEISNCLYQKTLSPISCLAFGIVLYSSKNYLDAIAYYKSSLKDNEKCLNGYFLLTRAYLKIYKYSDAKSVALTGLKLEIYSKSPVIIKIRSMLHLYLAEALAGLQLWIQTLQFVDKAIEKLGRSPECLDVLIKVYLKMNEMDKVKEICEELKAIVGESAQILQLEATIYISEKNYTEAELKLQKAINLKSDSLSLHLIGLLYWNNSRTKESFDYFMKAAKEDPYYSKNFLYLGHYYLKEIQDFLKALKCYKKAFELDIYDTEAGIALSDLLKELNEDESNLQILQKVIKHSPVGSAKWARFRLGLYYLQQENILSAINVLQSALQCDPTDSQCWEAIGEAYLLRGSYNSALKSFEKAVELNPSNLHSQYCVAQILLVTGIFTNAIEEFQSIIKKEATYIPAYKGLVEAFLYQAKYYLSECLYGRFKDCCQDAICTLLRAVSFQPRFSCFWKLFGDSLTLPAALDSEYFPFILPGKLLNKNSETVLLEKNEMLNLGGKFYCQALAIHPEIDSLWHDLGINYYYQSNILKENKKLAVKSLLCVQKAITINPNSHKYWNTLGIIAASHELKNYSLSQHCFIKSVESESDNAIAWTNLGVLYLLHNEIQLAHNSFKNAQKSNPSYPVCWIGQALVAETIGHTQTTDLFRHAITIGNHPEGLLGYGHWVCKALQEKNSKNLWYKENIIDMTAIPIAIDCLIKYTENNKSCPAAFNILGLLLENQGLYRESLNSFKKSIELHQLAKSESSLQDTIVNYARLCIVNKKPEEAVTHFSKIEKHNEFSLCTLALAYYHIQNYNKCNEAFQRATELVSSKEVEVCIVIAKAMVIKQQQGLKEMKLFLENFQASYKFFEGLQMICILAILLKDINLAKETLQKLEQFRSTPKAHLLIPFLSSCFYIIQEKKEEAKWQLCKAIFKFPNDYQLWIQLALVLLQKYNNSYISIKIMKTASYIICGSPLESPLTPLSHIAAGNVKFALRESQKLLHLRPDVSFNWLILLTSCYGAGIGNIDKLFNIVHTLIKKDENFSKLFIYVSLLEVSYHMHLNNISDAKLILNKLNQNYMEDTFISSIIKFMKCLCDLIVQPIKLSKESLKELTVLIQQIPEFTWGILKIIKLQSKTIKDNETTEYLQEILQNENISLPSRLIILIQLSIMAYKISKRETNSKKYLSLSQENLDKALKLSPHCQIAHFLQAMIAERIGNQRLQRRSLERVLESQISYRNLWIEDYSRNILQKIHEMKDNQKEIKL